MDWRPPGARLGRYEIVRLLGEGAMGEVYEANLHGPGGFRKPVALKILRPGKRPARLAAEARLGGLLRHLNLVEVYALEEVDGTWMIAMELVRGGTLADHAPLPPAAVVEAAIQACTGLDHAHTDIGLIHLDLKPSNLLLDGATVKVADLGVALALGHGRDLVSGTPGYMAPEHASGGHVDVRTDIWSMGMVMTALALGRPHRDPHSVPWLHAVLERCLAPDPSHRFPSFRALIAALQALGVEGPALAPAVGFTPAVRRQAQATTGSLDSWTLDDADAFRPRSNMGTEIDAFVGRESELNDLIRRLDRPGLVTLKGPGGMGKTRLARAAGRTWHTQTLNEAWFVDLTQAHDVEDVLYAMAATLDVPVLGGALQDGIDRVGLVLEGRGDVLLLLDNLEQIAGAMAPMIRGWMEGAPRLRVLATSRVPLQLQDEQVVDLEPLPVQAAVELLRARAPNVSVSPELAEVARRLDGMPLALELAAARLRMLSPAQLLRRLDLRLLSRGGRDRHATLTVALDASWEPLSDAARAVLPQLSVFRGGFTLESAEAVVAVEAFLPDVIEQLEQHSLVFCSMAGAAPRFDLLEPVREWCAGRLRDPDAVRLRHAAHFAGLGGSADPALLDAEQGVEQRSQMTRELQNLVAACRLAIEREEPELATRTAAAVFQVVHIRGPVPLGLDLAEGALSLDGLTVRQRADLLRCTGNLRRVSMDLDRAAEDLQAAIVGLIDVGATREQGVVLSSLGIVHDRSGRLDAAQAAHEMALELHRSVGDRMNEGVTLGNLAVSMLSAGETSRARDLFLRAIALNRETNSSRYEGINLGNLGNALTRLGRPRGALRRYHQALQIHREVGNKRFEGITLGNLGALHGRMGDLEQAARHFEAAIEIHRLVGERRFEVTALGNLARCAQLLGNLEQARSSLRTALDYADERGSRSEALSCWLELGRTAHAEGELDEAGRCYAQAIRIGDEVGDLPWKAMAMGLDAERRMDLGQLEGAIELADESIAMLEGRMLEGWGRVLAIRGEARARAGDLPASDLDFSRSLEVLRDRGFRFELLEALCARIRVDRIAGRDPTALEREARALLADLGLGEGSPGARNLARSLA